jgi:5-methylthioadenosine/S-adenosylhomocysteine deaminase
LKLLNDRTLAVHCVWYNDTDIEIAKATGIKVAHCPIANMYLADGVAPIPTMLGSGICVGLGTDGPASNNNLDMFGVMKSAVLLQKVHNMNPQALSCQDALDMATIKGAESLGLEKDTGSLEVGKKGDMVILDAYDFNMLPANNPISSLIYCATPGNVQIVIIEGKIVFENGKFPHLDEDRVKEEAGDVVNDVSPSVYGS